MKYLVVFRHGDGLDRFQFSKIPHLYGVVLGRADQMVAVLREGHADNLVGVVRKVRRTLRLPNLPNANHPACRTGRQDHTVRMELCSRNA